MKKVICILQLLVVALMLAAPQQAKATAYDVIINRSNYMMIPQGNGLFTIKVPVYVGNWNGNRNAVCWGDGRTSAVYVEAAGTKHELVRFKSENLDNDAASNQDFEIQFDRNNHGLGACNVLTWNGTMKEAAPTEWTTIKGHMTKDVTGEYNTMYLEFTWKADYKFHDQELKLSAEGYYDKSGGSVEHMSVNFNPYTYKSTLQVPTIAGAYLNPDAVAGSEGQIKVVTFSSFKPEELVLLINGKQQKIFNKDNCDLESGTIELLLEPCDTTRILTVETTCKEDGVVTKLLSKPYTLFPYHKILDKKVLELHENVPQISSGHKQLTWSIDATTSNDMYASDNFIIERAYLPDFSDAQQIGLRYFTDTISAGKYKFVDDSDAAVFNLEGGSKMYYRVRRATAVGLFGTEKNIFSVCDSVENQVAFLPQVSAVTIQENSDYEFNRKVSVNAEIDLKDYKKDESQGGAQNKDFYAAKWNDQAKIKLYIRQDGVVADSVDFDTRELQLDTLQGVYKVSREYVLTHPVVDYSFLAKVLIPESASSYLKFASGKKEDDGKYSTPISYKNVASVRNVSATQGTEYGFVRVSWEMPGNRIDSLTVLRRVKNQTDYVILEKMDAQHTYFEDHDAALGVEYEYGIIAGVLNGSKMIETTSWDESGYTPSYGWVSNVGKITGKVVTNQGTGMGGQLVNVTLGDGNVVKSTYTNDNGTFVIDGLELKNEGIIYMVQVPSEKLQFTYNGGTEGASVNFSGSTSLMEGLKFVCTSVERFSGRVLFENSTVPVSGAMFLINGKKVHNEDNQPIKTDNNGNFEFYVPKQEVTVQVYKPGHRFVNDGYVLDMDKDTTHFTPNSAYDGLTLYDKTKVLLRGRIIGGNTQAALPLGQGLSENNLGDSITLQIKLEGNNTADIVFLKDQPDKDSLVVYKEQQWNGKTVGLTRGDFFRKQIDIHVDNKTGEYAMELFPTKYKIIQASAQGYASLLAHGEVSQVLDLTDSVAVDSTQMKIATHSITYHSDVDITFKQLQWGVMEVPYLGAEKTTGMNMFGSKYTTTLANVVEPDSVVYLLDKPIFLTGEHYFLRGTAHEDYYYNNVSTGKHVIEPIHSGDVKVENGLAGSNPQIQEFKLDDKGQFTISFIANNNNFALSGEDALCQLNSSVLVNGFYYQSKPIKAYVTGQRAKPGEVFTAKDADIRLLDILRDPPGANSYSYYGKGKQMQMSRTVTFHGAADFRFDISTGANYSTIVGLVETGFLQATSQQGDNGYSTSFSIPVVSLDYLHTGTYRFTSNEEIKTSDDPMDVGANADVYIGATSDMICQTLQSIAVIDDTTYNAQKANIEAGLVKVIQKGKDKNGNGRYLVVAEQLAAGYTVPSTFVYSQKHILTKVIPQLVAERNDLLIGGEGITEEMVQALADEQNKTLYFYEGGSKNEAGAGKYDVKYKQCTPKKQNASTDEIANYNDKILKWLGMISFNEQLKVGAYSSLYAKKDSYSLSAGQNVSHSEQIAYNDYYDGGGGLSGKFLGFNLTKGNNVNNILKSTEKALNSLIPDGAIADTEVGKNQSEAFKKKQAALNAIKGLLTTQADSTKFDDRVAHTDISTPVAKFSLKITPDFDLNYDDKEDHTGTEETFESGYEMKLNDDSYMNVSVYQTPASTIKSFNKNEEESDPMQAAHDFVTGKQNEAELLHQYIFYVNGGATRNPWCDADSTIFYKSGTPLGVRTQKIDNPVLKINTPEISNVPDDETATFTIKLINDTELTGNQTTTHESEFTLSLVDESNEKGAKISIDGMPLTDGRTFKLAPGASMNKTVEVLRGDGYDFENLMLELSCKDDPLNTSFATFSVHYLPTSSPVRISSPTDKWVINTFSAKDSIGYYMPIVVDDYNLGYKNFDHIEIQYKKSTEGDANWVNLCSYYIDDDLYEAASGTKSKEQIGTGKITHAFYGEKDPIEMKYDIRAVTFCRLGTGFVTRASDVISGTKDTRRPTIFGQSQPLNGILTNENNILLPFSEPIAYNYLDETSNFDIRGYVNLDAIDANVGLVFPGEADQDASSSISRNLSNRPFTIDMLVQPDEDRKEMTFFYHGDADRHSSFTFGINAQKQLFVNCNDTIIKSVPLTEPVNQSINHVGAEYTIKTKEDGSETGCIRFFAGNSFIDNEAGSDGLCPVYTGNSPIHFGVSKGSGSHATAPFKGRMLEVRLWNQAISADMVSQYNKKMLDGYSNRIIGYWPMRQAGGDAQDVITGANLTLQNVNWNTEKGHSLIVNDKSYALDGASFQRPANFDYTLSFWMNIKEATKEAMLFSAGGDSIAEEGQGKMRIGFIDGNLAIHSNNITTKVGDRDTSNLADGKWHHFALSVSHSKNLANIYLDGKLCNQLQGDKVDGISMDNVRLGSKGLKANFDLLTFWHQALPQNYLEQIMRMRLSGDEMGLYVYLPFDTPKESTQGPLSERFTANNMATNKDIYNKTVVLNVDEQNDVDDINCAPILGSMPLSKLKFSWSSDGTNLLINLDMKDSEINHRNIFITVRDVEDLNGNTMANPYSWVIYTDRNILRWDAETKYIQMEQGWPVSHEVTWKNHTSLKTNYNIQTSSPYIKIDDTMGVASPNYTNNLCFTIEKGMTPGDYVEYIWLTDEDNNMVSTLTLNISVQAKEPNWAVDQSKFDQTMTVIAQVHKEYDHMTILDNDTRDKVGVFAGSECVGVANISDDKGLARVYLNVYGNSNNNGEKLSFYLWDYSEGTISQLTPSTDVMFVADSIVGMPTTPLMLTSSKSKMQEIALEEGWNWVALNVKPLDASSPKAVFFNSRTFSNGDIVKDDSKHVEYSASNNRWIGDDLTFTNEKVYHIYANRATRVNLVGKELTKDERKITIKQGWNHLPYLMDFTQPVSLAMSDFQGNDKATEGDIIKGINSFAVLSGDYGWIGSLLDLEPGMGYYLYHTGKEYTIEFNSSRTTGSENAGSSPAKARRAQTAENNMIVIAAMAEGEDLPEDAIVKAYAGSECIGQTAPITLSDGTVRYFVTIPETEQGVHFVIENEASEPQTVGALLFNAATCIGTLESPYILSGKNHLSDSDALYDLSGRHVGNNPKARGIYVKKGTKVAK